jgi:hypothetical protein
MEIIPQKCFVGRASAGRLRAWEQRFRALHPNRPARRAATGGLPFGSSSPQDVAGPSLYGSFSAVQFADTLSLNLVAGALPDLFREFDRQKARRSPS